MPGWERDKMDSSSLGHTWPSAAKYDGLCKYRTCNWSKDKSIEWWEAHWLPITSCTACAKSPSSCNRASMYSYASAATSVILLSSKDAESWVFCISARIVWDSSLNPARLVAYRCCLREHSEAIWDWLSCWAWVWPLVPVEPTMYLMEQETPGARSTGMERRGECSRQNLVEVHKVLLGNSDLNPD